MLARMERRDRYEAALDAIKSMENANRQNTFRMEYQFKQKLEQYEKWKKDNDMEGVKY